MHFGIFGLLMMWTMNKRLPLYLVVLLLPVCLFAQTDLERTREQVREIIKEKIHFPEGAPIITDLSAPAARNSSTIPNEMVVSGVGAPESEVHAAIFSNDSNIMVTSAMRQQGGLAMPIWYTNDFGNTWNLSSYSPSPQYSNAVVYGGGDPNFVYDDNGRLYYSWINLFQKSSISDSIFWALYWAYSDDHGVTWQQSPRKHIGLSKKNGGLPNINSLTVRDKQWMAADRSPFSPYYNSIYCTFLEASGITGVSYIGLRYKRETDTEFTTSTTVVSGLNWAFVQFGNVAVTSDGVVHVTFFGSQNGQSYHMYHCKSTDGGDTFSTPTEITQANVPSFTAWDPNPNLTGVTLQRFYPSCYLAADISGGANDGSLYLTWTANGIDTTETYGLDVWLSYSRDGGTTWSTPQRVNNDNAPQQHQFYSSIYVDDQGDVMLGWYDRRDDLANIATDYYIGISTDGGVTFSNIKANLTPTLFTTVGNSNNGFGIGEYTQVLGCKGSVIPFWSDGRNNNGNLDIYSATVNKADGLTDPEFGPVTEAVVWKELYPNPTADHFTLYLELKYRSDLTLSIYAVDGRLVGQEAMHRAAGPFKKDFSTSDLAAGRYLVELQTDYGRFVKSLVVR